MTCYNLNTPADVGVVAPPIVGGVSPLSSPPQWAESLPAPHPNPPTVGEVIAHPPGRGSCQQSVRKQAEPWSFFSLLSFATSVSVLSAREWRGRARGWGVTRQAIMSEALRAPMQRRLGGERVGVGVGGSSGASRPVTARFLKGRGLREERVESLHHQNSL